MKHDSIRTSNLNKSDRTVGQYFCISTVHSFVTTHRALYCMKVQYQLQIQHITSSQEYIVEPMIEKYLKCN